jgi:spore germination protein GerM
MMARAAAVTGVALVAASVAWVLFVGLPRWYPGPSPTNASAASPPAPRAPAATGRKITARLFYVSDDGAGLISVERDVPFAEGTLDQARHIVEAQLAAPPEPLVSAVPAGTTLRALFVTERGHAFVDLSRDVVTGHTGGSMSETLTVYTLVDALTANLPAITAVQILVDGKQRDTLAGHVDLRRPLAKNLAWVQ